MIRTLLRRHAFSLIITLFVANIGIYFAIQMRSKATTCFYSTAEVGQDARCLYIYSNGVYEKGTKSNPHKNHPCGTDVTAILPSFHFDLAQFTSAHVGDLCSVPAASPTPTIRPTSTPTPTQQPTRTVTPTYMPTQTMTPTKTPTPIATKTSTPMPIQSSTPSPLARPTNTIPPSPTRSILTPTNRAISPTRPAPTRPVSSIPIPTPTTRPVYITTPSPYPQIQVVVPATIAPTLSAPACIVPPSVQHIRILCPICQSQ